MNPVVCSDRVNREKLMLIEANHINVCISRNKQLHLMGLSCWFGLVVLQTVTEVVISPWSILRNCKCVWDGNMHVEVKEGAEPLRPPGEFGMCPASPPPRWLRVKVNNRGRKVPPPPPRSLSWGSFQYPTPSLGPTPWQTASPLDQDSCFNGCSTPSDT